MNNDFKTSFSIGYKSTYDGRVIHCSRYVPFQMTEKERIEYIETMKNDYKNDPNFSIVAVHLDEDFELVKRMRAVREICELGHRVRADAKIRNRQPLRKAYALFSDSSIHNYMTCVDDGSDTKSKHYQQYSGIIADELNVFEVEFVGAENTGRFFNLNLKPNFRSLGKRGLGKQAQTLKQDLTSLSFTDRNNLITTLKQEKEIELTGIKLSLDDLEIEYLPKCGFASATSDVGAIVLDVALNEELLEHGFVADFRSFIQNIRKETKLNLTDRIQLEINCSEQRQAILSKEHFRRVLEKDLLASRVEFKRSDGWDAVLSMAHKFEFGNECISVVMYLENAN